MSDQPKQYAGMQAQFDIRPENHGRDAARFARIAVFHLWGLRE